MNEDVILHIFPMLPFDDLLAAAGTCQRLRDLAHYSFKIHPRLVMLTLKMIFGDDNDNLQEMFQSIGPNVRELTFNVEQ